MSASRLCVRGCTCGRQTRDTVARPSAGCHEDGGFQVCAHGCTAPTAGRRHRQLCALKTAVGGQHTKVAAPSEAPLERLPWGADSGCRRRQDGLWLRCARTATVYSYSPEVQHKYHTNLTLLARDCAQSLFQLRDVRHFPGEMSALCVHKARHLGGRYLRHAPETKIDCVLGVKQNP